MKGDFSRIQVDVGKHDEVWLRQQGRVFLDSDQNEAELTRLELRRREIRDLVGPVGAPDPGTGFQIGPGPTFDDLTIGGGPGPAGRIYVDGIAVQNDAPTTYQSQPDFDHPPALQLPDPTETGWTLTGPLGSARFDHASAELNDGRVLVVGGQTSGAPLSSAEIYDPKTKAWSGTGSLTTPRAGHSATLLPDGRVLVAGGSGPLALASAELYDPGTGTWSVAAAMHHERFFHTASLLLNGTVLVAGGASVPSTSLASIPTSGTLNTVEIYDPSAGTWTEVAHMGTARAHHTATVLPGLVHVLPGPPMPIRPPDVTAMSGVAGPLHGPGIGPGIGPGVGPGVGPGIGPGVGPGGHPGRPFPVQIVRESTVLVAGGSTDGLAVNSSEVFDTVSKSWSSTRNNMTAAREMHTATVLTNGSVLVCGGSQQDSSIASAEVFSAGSWVAVPAMSRARARHTATLLKSGRVVVAGGKSGTVALDSTELYDPGQIWTVTQPLNEPRFDHTAHLLAGGQVLVAGGTHPGSAGLRLAQPTGLALPFPGPRPGPTAFPPSGPRATAPSGPEVSSTELYEPAASTYAVAYLDVWRRAISPLQDPDILEPALGSDTTVRLRTVAQVKIIPLSPADEPAQLDCAHSAQYLPGPGSGRLTTIVSDQASAADECQLPDASNYLGRENRLYRIEIDDPGEPQGFIPPAPLPLGRDVAPGDTQLLLTTVLSPDQAKALTEGRWYLLQGDTSVMRQEPLTVLRTEVVGTVGRGLVRQASLVTLASGVRHRYSAAAGARLARALPIVGLRTQARPTETHLVLPLDQVAAVGRRASWLLGEPGNQEAISIRTVDTMTGRATLDGPLTLQHAAGTPLLRPASYKWSRYNAAFAVGAQVLDATGSTTTLKVESLGRDQASMLRKNDLVELIGDRSELIFGRGLLCYVHSDPDPEQLQVVLDSQVDPTLAGDTHLILRRWDGSGPVTLGQIDLGEGVHIQFSGSDFRSGDYWWFTTRAADGSQQRLTNAPPNGVEHHRQPLAVLHWIGERETEAVLQPPLNCVPVFEPMTGIDAEDIAFDDRLSHLNAGTVQQAIDVIAARAQPSWPTIQAMSWHNDRPLSLAAFNQGISVTFSEAMHPATVTRDTFLVSVDLPVGTTRQSFQVNGDVTSVDGLKWVFTPRPLIGPALLQSWVSGAGTGTPPAAIAHAMGGVGPGPIVQPPGPIFQPPGPIFQPPGPIAQPGPIVQPPGPIVQPPGPIVQPPGPIAQPPPIVQPPGPIVQPPGPIVQPPAPIPQPPQPPPGSIIQIAGRVRCRVQLKGNAILDARGERPLDGNAFGRVAKVGYDVFTDLTLPSGDTIRGGDFESWCFLVPPTVPVTVMNIYPPRDSVFPADAPPDFVHVTFTKQVQVATLTTKDNFQLLDPSGQQVVGRIDPYPYSTTARTVDAVTFSPRAPLQAQERLNEFTVVLRGTGSTPILDVDGQPLGGGAPDFKSRFYLTPHLKGPVDTPGPIFRPPGPIFEPPGPIVEPPGPILQPPGPILQPPGPILRGPGPILRGLGPIAQPPGPILREPDPMMREAGPGSLGGRALPGPQVAPSPEEAG